MTRLTAAIAAMLLIASPAFAEVHVAMHDGRVSIQAKDATLRQILTEWARIGGTRIINVDKIPGGPVTLVLENVTEMQALEVLLRPLSGYIAAPRAVAAADLSAYDRIIIMPTLADVRPTPMAAASSSATAALPPPVYQPPPAPVVVQSTDDDVNDPTGGSASGAVPANPQSAAAASAQRVAAGSAPNVAAGSTESGGDPPNSSPRGLEVGRRVFDSRTPPRPPAPAAPRLPAGVAVPGMIAPAPPGQAPGAPGQPVRRPGGL
jgi:hypothetical protein